jgi:hypothetical protein
MTKTTDNKPTRRDLDQKAMDGVDAHLASAGTVTIDGEQFTPATLKAVFQGDIDAMGETDAARTTLKAKVQAAKAARTRADAVRKALKAFVIGQFGLRAVQVIEGFGFEVPKAPGPKTAKDKAEATEKGQATRKRVRRAVQEAKAETPAPATTPTK